MHVLLHTSHDAVSHNRPISVYRLGEMPIQSCGQSVSAPRGKPGVWLNAHAELRAKRQRSAREATYRNRTIGACQILPGASQDVVSYMGLADLARAMS